MTDSQYWSIRSYLSLREWTKESEKRQRTEDLRVKETKSDKNFWKSIHKTIKEALDVKIST